MRSISLGTGHGDDDRRARRARLVRFTLLLLSILAAFTLWCFWYDGGLPVDAWAFYNPEYGRSAFAYIWSPAFAQLTAPLRLLPFPIFVAVVRALELASLIAMAPYGAWVVLGIEPVSAEVNAANINLILIACVVASIRWPAAWVLPLLTKPSMGVGLLWYVARGEWRKLAIALGVTGAIAIVSFTIDPAAWWAWLEALRHHGDIGGPGIFSIPVWPRLPVAAVIVIWGARTNRPWTVALAAIIGIPRTYLLTIAMLVGLIPLLRSGSVASSFAWWRRTLLPGRIAPSPPPPPTEDAG
jgi:hypothetical protein